MSKLLYSIVETKQLIMKTETLTLPKELVEELTDKAEVLGLSITDTLWKLVKEKKEIEK